MNVLHEHLEELTKNRDSLQNELDMAERKLLEATVNADVLGSFINAVDDVTNRAHHNYEVGYGGAVRSTDLGFDIDYPYTKFPTSHLAEQLAKIYKFNGMLLAFKYCYDLDYKPVFSGDYDNRAYSVYYDSEDGEYDWSYDSVNNRSIVYFSTKEIAQKCADWLNSLKED